jgi:hypothetical protein
MSLITPVPPAACAAAFSAQVPMFLSGASGVSEQNYLGAAPHVPSLADITPGVPVAQQVFQLSLNAAGYNTGAINPAAAGWRFLAGPPSNPVLGRMVQIPPSQAWKLTGVFFGLRVSEALLAVQPLYVLPDVVTNDYELRVLAVPGLNLEVFWLAAQKAGTSDLIVPFPSASSQIIPSLRSQFPYKMVTFLALLKPLAGGLLTMAASYGA